jgi:ABC-2 type transport system ATP-binding protein
MSDITTLAKRIILIGKGKVLYDGNLRVLKNKYDTEKNVSIKTKERLDIKNKGIKTKKKTKEGYEIVIDTKEISISELLNRISKKITIEDVDIDNNSIDNLIVKLYEDFKI